MKKVIIYFCFMLPLAVFSQKKKATFIEPKPYYGVFGRKYNLSFSKRLLKYPFNEASQIKLVSFNYDGGQIEDTVYYNPIMPKLNYAVCRFPFAEIKSLSYLQIDMLTDILINYGYIRKPNVLGEFKCYDPANGILFFNKNEKVFELIEICFNCKKVVFGSEKIKIEMQQEKIDMLKLFFIKSGIKIKEEH